MHDPELAAEDARRYAEWRSLLVELLEPLVATPASAEEEAETLIALVDGLGLRLARDPSGDPVPPAARRHCIATLDRTLDRMSLK